MTSEFTASIFDHMDSINKAMERQVDIAQKILAKSITQISNNKKVDMDNLTEVILSRFQSYSPDDTFSSEMWKEYAELSWKIDLPRSVKDAIYENVLRKARTFDSSAHIVKNGPSYEVHFPLDNMVDDIFAKMKVLEFAKQFFIASTNRLHMPTVVINGAKIFCYSTLFVGNNSQADNSFRRGPQIYRVAIAKISGSVGSSEILEDAVKAGIDDIAAYYATGKDLPKYLR